MTKKILKFALFFSVALLLIILLLNALDSSESKFKGPVSPGEAIPAELIASLEAYVDRTMHKYDVPGVAMVLVQGDRVIYSNALGVRDLDSKAPVTMDTLMGIGSSTKTMTAVMIATMVDEGLINWDTPVRAVWPDFQLSDPEISDTLTFQHLLCMCTGVPRRMEDLSVRFSELTPEAIIESLKDIPLQGSFERHFAYSSRMLAAAGYMAAMVEGSEYGQLEEGYWDIMQSRIFDPLEMRTSTFSVSEAVASGNYATPYYAGLTEVEATPVNLEEIFRPIAPAGALWSSAEEMSKYLVMLVNEGKLSNGQRLVSTENLDVLWEPGVRIDANNVYGLGWHVENYNGIRVVHHPGGTVGFAAELVVLPEYDLGFALLSNKLDMVAPIGRMTTYRLLEMLTGAEQTYDDEIKATKGDIDKQVLLLSLMAKRKMDPDAIAPFIGDYTNDSLGKVSILLDSDNSLWMDVGEYEIPIRKLRMEEDTYILYTSIFIGKTLVMGMDSGGVPMMTLTGDEGNYRFIMLQDAALP